MFNSLQRRLDSSGSAPILTCRHSGTNTHTYKLAYTRVARLHPLIWHQAQKYDPRRTFIGPLIYSASRPISEKQMKAFVGSVVPLQMIYIQLITSHLVFFISRLPPSLLRTVQSKPILCKQEQTHHKKCHKRNIRKQQADKAPKQRKCYLEE